MKAELIKNNPVKVPYITLTLNGDELKVLVWAMLVGAGYSCGNKEFPIAAQRGYDILAKLSISTDKVDSETFKVGDSK